MLYLNIKTERRTEQFIDDATTIPVDDTRVALFFQPYDKVKYDLILNGDTYELKEYQLQEDGTRYRYYLDDGTPDFVKIDTENYKDVVAHGESLVKGVVKAEIKKYNEDNKVNFESINNCALYKDDLDHPHQPFCIAIIAYNSLIWKEARRIQEQISTGAIPMPTDQGFIDMLPKFA